MAKNQGNGRARWIVVAGAVVGLIFNSGILYNDVRHLKEDIAEVKQEIKELRLLFIEMM
jgi:hypothetical protein